jgi:hypothetical protein
VCASPSLLAHDGPPFPIVSDRIAGPYLVSVWTDPDATDDGTAGGQFWVTLAPADGREAPLAGTTARVTIRPLSRTGPERTTSAEPVRGDVTNQFAALVMDHEGPFAVRVVVKGSLGSATIDTQTDATYDLRPPAYMLAWYLMPFIVAGVLWTRLLLRRRAKRNQA